MPHPDHRLDTRPLPARTPNPNTLERLAAEIRIANGTSSTALLDPVRDPETMLAAALAVAFALEEVQAPARQVMITRYAAHRGVLTFASIAISSDEGEACTAERRLHASPLPELSAYVWIDEGFARGVAALQRLGGVVAFGACGFVAVDLPLAAYEEGCVS